MMREGQPGRGKYPALNRIELSLISYKPPRTVILLPSFCLIPLHMLQMTEPDQQQGGNPGTSFLPSFFLPTAMRLIPAALSGTGTGTQK